AHFKGAPWNTWPREIRQREPRPMSAARRALADEVGFHSWTQWCFHSAWEDLRAHARDRGISIVGDMPIFVAYDSADVWAHPEHFYLDDDGNPTVVAGVPPDYFSATGQRWGNPLYRWDALEDDGFAWWIARIRQALRTCDLVRIDHFRGFEAYWEIPATEPTAVRGRWVRAPGKKLLQALQAEVGQAPILAEDLGVITPEVETLRDRFGFPGMRVLQFAFGNGEESPHLPHNYPPHGRVLVYTGTHDNDTTLGWYRSAPPAERERARAYLAQNGIPLDRDEEAPWALISLAFGSRAALAMVPLQDVLGLGGRARMNHPGRPEGNWAWRYRGSALTEALAARLQALAVETGRVALYGSVR
ncbi:MAG: 4-alpha-glucanotransferase, partial [Candidatus Bipolaricaulota bacterium]